jgi:hypothetical protein
MPLQPFAELHRLSVSLLLIVLTLVFSTRGYTIPAFARMFVLYRTNL